MWINGKPSGLTEENRAQILEQMPAGSIEAVEVITNPSSKYSAEGSAGIINIVMKQDSPAGVFGNVTAGLSYPSEGKLGGNLGASVNITKNKWTIFCIEPKRNFVLFLERMVRRFYEKFR